MTPCHSRTKARIYLTDQTIWRACVTNPASVSQVYSWPNLKSVLSLFRFVPVLDVLSDGLARYKHLCEERVLCPAAGWFAQDVSSSDRSYSCLRSTSSLSPYVLGCRAQFWPLSRYLEGCSRYDALSRQPPGRSKRRPYPCRLHYGDESQNSRLFGVSEFQHAQPEKYKLTAGCADFRKRCREFLYVEAEGRRGRDRKTENDGSRAIPIALDDRRRHHRCNWEHKFGPRRSPEHQIC